MSRSVNIFYRRSDALHVYCATAKYMSKTHVYLVNWYFLKLCVCFNKDIGVNKKETFSVKAGYSLTAIDVLIRSANLQKKSLLTPFIVYCNKTLIKTLKFWEIKLQLKQKIIKIGLAIQNKIYFEDRYYTSDELYLQVGKVVHGQG